MSKQKNSCSGIGSANQDPFLIGSGIYLDNSATTRPYDEVSDFIDTINRRIYGNPSSLHRMGIDAEKLVNKARNTIAATLNVESTDVFFTSGGTESNNLAIRGYLEANPRKGRHILTTKVEHPSVTEVFKYLGQSGYEAEYLEVDRNGIIDPEKLRSSIKPETSLISVIYVNNETGAIQPLEEIIRIRNAVNRQAAIHVDAVQAYGKLWISPKKSGIDLLTFSSHKIHGPKGVGALYVNRTIKVKPILFGGGQEALLRSGTENVPGIAGFGLAAGLSAEQLDENIHKVQDLKKYLTDKLIDKFDNVRIISPENSSPYILNAAFRGLHAQVLLNHMEEKNIFISSGSACSSRKKRHSHVLKAMGVEPCYLEGAVRISFSAGNTIDEIDYFLKALEETIPEIRYV